MYVVGSFYILVLDYMYIKKYYKVRGATYFERFLDTVSWASEIGTISTELLVVSVFERALAAASLLSLRISCHAPSSSSELLSSSLTRPSNSCSNLIGRYT